MPPIELQDDDSTPDELEFLARGGAPADAPAPAQAAAAPAPEDDDSGDDATQAPAPAPAAAPGETPPDGAVDDEGAIDKASAEPVASADAPALPTYDAPAARDFAAEFKTIKDAQAALTKQWRDGELSDDDYDARIAPLQDQRDALLVEQTKASTIETLNRQAVIQEQTKVLEGIKAASAAANQIDYDTEEGAANAFNAMYDAVAADPRNAGKPFAQLAPLAHQALCAARGILAAAPAPAPTPAPALAPNAKPKPVIPQTLHGMPVAGATPMGNEAMQTLTALDDPDAAESMLEAMPRSQREALARSTVNVNPRSRH